MHFRYKLYQQERAADIRHPLIETVLRNARNDGAPVIAYEALVDSGSDRCIFPSELAHLLGRRGFFNKFSLLKFKEADNFL